MKDAFIDEIHESQVLDELTLIRLKVSSALGACYLAAEKINWIFTKSYEDNIEMFYHYKRDNYIKLDVSKDLIEAENPQYILCSSTNRNYK